MKAAPPRVDNDTHITSSSESEDEEFLSCDEREELEPRLLVDSEVPGRGVVIVPKSAPQVDPAPLPSRSRGDRGLRQTPIQRTPYQDIP